MAAPSKSVRAEPSRGVTLGGGPPVRTCVGCRVRDYRHNLLRFVATAGSLQQDPKKAMPGRGAWVHPECLSTAGDRRAFNRALRGTFDTSVALTIGRDAAQTPGSGLEADGHPMSTQR
ncbi:MAG: YlxR family protein [Ruaniaceae bacterium]|nr:YlxR family protein [Ruaniaceae bacterium]